ncbi:MAG: hypothetical protein ABI680_18475 [Chthoniobacteraceae bacterium]
MALFQLDPASIVARAKAAGVPLRQRALCSSMALGAIGFALVSVAGFAPWPIFGYWFRNLGEVALYMTCTLVFLAGSGLLLHRLILGPGSLWRCYALFSLAFLAYAVVWVLCWMGLRGEAGEWTGAFGGTAVMGIIFALAFGAPRQIPLVVVTLFAFHTLGYEIGDRVAHKLMSDHRALAMLAWGACYGLGFGAGLGAAFYSCQKGVAALAADGRAN